MEAEVGVVPTRRSTFEMFYRAEYAPVVRFAFALVGQLGPAEELAQEAFLVAFRDWDRVERYEQPGAWVRRVVANRGVSMWRRRGTESRTLDRLRRERPNEVRLDDPDAAVWSAVRALPRRQRQVLALVALEDRTVNEVAVILECSPESVRTHLRRGRSAVAKRLREVE